jgi:cytochrome c5
MMKRLFTIIISFALFSFILSSCGGEPTENQDTTEDNTEAVTEEQNAEPADEIADNFQKGKEVYDKICYTCHDGGIAGAAKLDDKARWEESAAKGKDQVIAHVVDGYTGEYGVLPAMGSCGDCSEEDIKAAVEFMFNEANVEL